MRGERTEPWRCLNDPRRELDGGDLYRHTMRRIAKRCFPTHWRNPCDDVADQGQGRQALPEATISLHGENVIA